MATLKHRVTDDGDHEIYVVEQGFNVQLSKVDAATFESRRANAETRGDTDKPSKDDAKPKGGE